MGGLACSFYSIVDPVSKVHGLGKVRLVMAMKPKVGDPVVDFRVAELGVIESIEEDCAGVRWRLGHLTTRLPFSSLAWGRHAWLWL